jgi:hypothetical protein
MLMPRRDGLRFWVQQHDSVCQADPVPSPRSVHRVGQLLCTRIMLQLHSLLRCVLMHGTRLAELRAGKYGEFSGDDPCWFALVVGHDSTNASGHVLWWLNAATAFSYTADPRGGNARLSNGAGLKIPTSHIGGRSTSALLARCCCVCACAPAPPPHPWVAWHSVIECGQLSTHLTLLRLQTRRRCWWRHQATQRRFGCPTPTARQRCCAKWQHIAMCLT